MTHPDIQTLEQLLDATLSQEAYEEADVHLSTCETCRETLNGILRERGLLNQLPPSAGGTIGLPQGTLVGGRYAIRRHIARGGQGDVYEAWQNDLGRRVAVKMLFSGGTGTPAVRLATFRQDAFALAKLTHPHIVPIYDYGEHDGQPYFVMEFLPGGSLAQKVNHPSEAGDQPPMISPTTDGATPSQPHYPSVVPPRAEPLPPMQAAQLVETLARAVHYAHGRGILHRDLKPQNILLAEDGTPKLGDFGLAWQMGAPAGNLDRAPTRAGTLPYMPPEQILGRREQIGPRSDVYALGALLHSVLTGRPPFCGQNDAEVADNILARKPVPPCLPRTGHDLSLICLKCLEKEPDRRYASAEVLAEELARFQRGEPPVETRPVSRLERLGRWGRRNPKLASATGLAGALLVTTTAVAVGWAVHASRQEGQISRAWNEQRAAEVRAREIKQAWDESDCARAVQRSQVHYDRGEIGTGLLWAVKALETAPDGAEDLCGFLRDGLAGWCALLFPLTACHPGTDELLAFGPGGQVAWVGEAGRSVRRRALGTGEPVGLPLPHAANVTAVAAARQGDVVLTVAGGIARLWDMGTATLRQEVRTAEKLDVAALSPDGLTVLTAERTQDGTTIRRWDACTGQPLAPACEAKGAVSALALSPDNRTLLAACGPEGGIDSWDVSTGRRLGSLPVPPTGYLALAYSPDGRALLSGGRDQTARLWDAASGRPLGPPLSHGGSVQVVTFSDDGRTLLTADARGAVRTWAVAEGPAPDRVFPQGRPVRSLAADPKDRVLAVGDVDGWVRLWGPVPDAPPRVLKHGHSITALRLSPDGQTLLTADWTGGAHLWDTATGAQKGKPLRHDQWVSAVAFSPDGKLAVTGSFDVTARTWDADTGESRTRFPHEAGVAALALDPAGARLVTGCTDGTAQVWCVATGQRLGPPLRHTATVRAVAFSPAGDRVLTAGADWTARLWDAATGQQIGPALIHGGTVWAAAFSPNGRQLLTGSWDGTGQLWDADTGQPRGQPLAHGDQVWAAAFSPDGQRVVTGSLDGTARLWDAASGRPLGPPLPHGGKVWAVAFCADTRTVVTASEDGQARLWKMPPRLDGSVARVRLWAEVITGTQLDSGGEARAFDAASWRQRKLRLEELGGRPAP